MAIDDSGVAQLGIPHNLERARRLSINTMMRVAIATTTLTTLLVTSHALLPTTEHLVSAEESMAFAQADSNSPSLESASLTVDQTLDRYTEAEKLYEMGGQGWDGIQRYKSALALLQDRNLDPSELEVSSHAL